MEQENFFPADLEEFLVPDTLFADAYAQTSDRERSGYKLAIARLAACLGEKRYDRSRLAEFLRQGSVLLEFRCPVLWAMVVWDETVESPSRILAALMPAVFADVAHVLACRAVSAESKSHIQPLSFSVLSALELAGQEAVADMPAAALAPLLTQVAAQGCGRLVLLGDSVWSGSLALEAMRLHIPVWNATAQARIGIAPFPPGAAGPDYDLLAQAQPDAHVFSVRNFGEAAGVSAIVCDPSAAGEWLEHAPLVLTPGHESCWLWPDLSLDFFQEKRQALS